MGIETLYDVKQIQLETGNVARMCLLINYLTVNFQIFLFGFLVFSCSKVGETMFFILCNIVQDNKQCNSSSLLHFFSY